MDNSGELGLTAVNPKAVLGAHVGSPYGLQG
jgi:hypothetical protein